MQRRGLQGAPEPPTVGVCQGQSFLYQSHRPVEECQYLVKHWVLLMRKQLINIYTLSSGYTSVLPTSRVRTK